MENRKVRLGMFVTILTFGLVLAACGSGPSPFSQLFGGSGGPGTSEFRTRRNDDGNLVIMKYTGRSEAVLIPAEFEGIPVVGIGEEAFSGNKTIKSVTIPEGVTVIEKDAFDGCTALTEIAIPASVIRIGEKGNDSEDSFDGCTALTAIMVAEANGVYSSEDWALFNKDKTALLLCPEGKSGNYTIPSSVTDIVYCAFEDCAKLTDVTIPDSVITIGERAFMDCIGLTSITIPNTVTAIGERAFDGCTMLASVTIPDSVTSIGELAFQSTGLTSVTIPGSVKVITGDIRDQGAHGVFVTCTALTSVTISEGVTSIGATAFFGCTKLASITIPNTVTAIGEQAFALCAGLASVSIPASVTSISKMAFFQSGLASVTIPEGVTSIDRQAFTKCAGLASVTIPDSATYIGPNAFSDCSALVSVTVSPVNGRKWDDIGVGADVFVNCPRLSAASKEALRRAGYTSF